MKWLFAGALLFLLIRNQFDLQRTGKDLRRILRAIGKAVRNAAVTIRKAAQEAGKKAEARKAVSEPAGSGNAVPAVCAESTKTKESTEPAEEPGQEAGIAAILANVPTLNFPEDDPKYDSSRKYTYA